MLRAYERDNVYLGEAGRLLVQQGVYTCPGLRRAIAQLEKQIGDGSYVCTYICVCVCACAVPGSIRLMPKQGHRPPY